MKVQIFGAGGMLGNELIKKYPHFDFSDINSKIDYCDIRDYNSVYSRILQYKPDYIFNFAALTDLEECENNPHNCYLTNTLAAINLFEKCKELNIPYVFISTAGIFGNEPIDTFDEEYIPSPLSHYGHSKYEVEKYIKSSNYTQWYIFRAGWMMGGGSTIDKKFVEKIHKQIRNNKKELFVVDDKAGTPTYTKDFANSIIKHLQENLPYGLYNQVSKGGATRYDVAQFMLKYLGYPDILLTKVDSTYFNKEYFANRPQSEILVNSKLDSLGKNYMRDWKICLKEYLDEYYK